MKGSIALVAAAAALLAACGNVVTNPDSVVVEPVGMAQVRTPQTVALRNAYQAPTPYELKTDSGIWVADQRQLTDTAIVSLRRALEKKGVTVAADSAKTVTLRLQVRSAWAQIAPANVFAVAWLTLEAQFDDGSTARVEGDERSGFGVTRAIEGATRVALQRLLFDPALVAYLNR